MSRRPRSRRSYVIEALLTAGVVLAIYLWITNGGPAAFGQWLAGYMSAS